MSSRVQNVVCVVCAEDRYGSSKMFETISGEVFWSICSFQR